MSINKNNKTETKTLELTFSEMMAILDVIAPIYKDLEFSEDTGTFFAIGTFNMRMIEVDSLRSAGLKLALLLKTEIEKNQN